MAKSRKIIQIQEKVPLAKGIPLSIQHTFAMFSASVLVPYILGISPSIALLMNGIGTLIFIFVTKGGAPAYLGSSFAFISPALIVIAQPGLGYRYALGGFVVTGLLMCLVALIIKFVGTSWIDAVLPPVRFGNERGMRQGSKRLMQACGKAGWSEGRFHFPCRLHAYGARKGMRMAWREDHDFFVLPRIDA